MSKQRTATVTNTSGPNDWTQSALDQYQKGAQAFQGSQNPALDQYLQQIRQLLPGLGFGMQTGLQGLNMFEDPYQKDVIGGIRGDFAYQRDLANRAGLDQATQAHAFGGTRDAVLRANLMSDVNRNETSTLANYRSMGFQSAVQNLLQERARQAAMGQAGLAGLFGGAQYGDQRQLAALGAFNPLFQYGGRQGSETQTSYSNPLDTLFGLASTAAGIYTGIKGPGGGAHPSASQPFYVGSPGSFNPPQFGSSVGYRSVPQMGFGTYRNQ